MVADSHERLRAMSDSNYTTTASCPPEVAAQLAEIPRAMAGEKAAWITELRSRGVKAAHPDDGWVDREANTVALVYATFNDGLQVGDLLALGSPSDSRGTRIVRVTGTIEAGPIVAPMMRPGEVYRYMFEDPQVR
jgi:hypothetical protein